MASLAIGFAGALVATLHAQTPPRDTRPTAPSGSDAAIPGGRAVIRGRVVAADTGRPLGRATVSATATIDGRREGTSISTDGEGRYELIGLRAGRYAVTVRRNGYLDIQYGQRLPREQGSFLEIEEAAIVDVDFRLPRASVVSGRITDEDGQPIANVIVNAVESRDNPARMFSGSATTDADGEYRIAGLMPGSYAISAGSNDLWASPDGNGRVGYARTYFPGATSSRGATRVAIGVGEEATEINFSLVAARLAAVSGIAVDSQGAPLQGLMLLTEDLVSAGSAVRLSGDGTFLIENVRPGQYTLRGGARGELASIPVEVSGADIAGVSVRSAPGWSVIGTLIVDPAANAALDLSRVAVLTEVDSPLAGPAVPTAAIGVVSGTIRLVSAGFGPPSMPPVGAPASARPERDGSFRVASVFGPSRIRVGLPPGWVVTSLTADGSNLMGRILDLAPGSELRNVEIAVTNRTAAVSGRVVDVAGAPFSSGTVVVFSEDSSRWLAWTGAVRETQPDRSGSFRVDGLPPGRYAVAAVEFVETGQWFEPAYLQSLLSRASRFSVAEDEHRDDVTVTVSK